MSGGNSVGSKGSKGGGVANSIGGGGARAGRGGWEEAGSEFYQESYPGGVDPEGVGVGVGVGPKTNIATLLPSKQMRATTVRRVRPIGDRRQSTAARGATNRDVLVSMLPDLSENLSNEESTWEEIMQIKAMPVPMAQKRDRKAQLQSATKLRLQGLEQLQWKRRKAWQGTRARLKETRSKLELWKSSFKRIEGNFGTGVVAYFFFLKWLLFLNLALSALIGAFVIAPGLYADRFASDEEECDGTALSDTISCCSESYFNVTETDGNIFLDVAQGTGPMERSVLFYGVYSHRVAVHYLGGVDGNFSFDENSSAPVMYYDLPLAYILTMIACFGLSLIAIVKSGAKGFKERLLEGEGQFYRYCNLLFGGWDFCIHNEKSAQIKHKALFNEIKVCLEGERREEERQARSTEEFIKLIIIRIIINTLVLLILVGSAMLIFFSFKFSNNELNNTPIDLKYNLSRDYIPQFPIGSDVDISNYNYTKTVESSINGSTTSELKLLSNEEVHDDNNDDTLGNVRRFVLQYLTSFCIVILNIIVPSLFRFLIQYERYRPAFVIKLTLFRTVFLRLSSLAVLLFQLYLLIINRNKDQCYNQESNQLQCWETYVGQQLYKLLIADFAIQICMTFFINFPRSMLARKSNSKCIKMIGEQEFNLPKHVLDVVYTQTLCWMGAFYCPFLPMIATVLCFFTFYLKKFACLINSKPPTTVYRASRSNSLFMVVLLISYCIATVPVGYAIAELSPSKGCGPFRSLNIVWEEIIFTFEKLPEVFRSVFFFLGTSTFAIPVFIVLVLLLYYYWAVADANRHMVTVLKSQLVLEGHDKQFLLNRLSAFIRQQYKKNERARQHHAHNNIADDDSITPSSK